MADSTLCDTVTRQLTDRYQSYVGLPCDDDVVQHAVISLHAVVVLVGNDMVGQGRSGKVLPHSLEAGHLLLNDLLVPIPPAGAPTSRPPPPPPPCNPPASAHCIHTHARSDTVAHHTTWLHHPKTIVAW